MAWFLSISLAVAGTVTHDEEIVSFERPLALPLADGGVVLARRDRDGNTWLEGRDKSMAARWTVAFPSLSLDPPEIGATWNGNPMHPVQTTLGGYPAVPDGLGMVWVAEEEGALRFRRSTFSSVEDTRVALADGAVTSAAVPVAPGPSTLQLVTAGPHAGGAWVRLPTEEPGSVGWPATRGKPPSVPVDVSRADLRVSEFTTLADGSVLAVYRPEPAVLAWRHFAPGAKPSGGTLRLEGRRVGQFGVAARADGGAVVVLLEAPAGATAPDGWEIDGLDGARLLQLAPGSLALEADQPLALADVRPPASGPEPQLRAVLPVEGGVLLALQDLRWLTRTQTDSRGNVVVTHVPDWGEAVLVTHVGGRVTRTVVSEVAGLRHLASRLLVHPGGVATTLAWASADGGSPYAGGRELTACELDRHGVVGACADLGRISVVESYQLARGAVVHPAAGVHVAVLDRRTSWIVLTDPTHRVLRYDAAASGETVVRRAAEDPDRQLAFGFGLGAQAPLFGDSTLGVLWVSAFDARLVLPHGFVEARAELYIPLGTDVGGVGLRAGYGHLLAPGRVAPYLGGLGGFNVLVYPAGPALLTAEAIGGLHIGQGTWSRVDLRASLAADLIPTDAGVTAGLRPGLGVTFAW